MKTICLLRGINVTGRRKIAMAALRSMATDMGLTGVRTWLQSGNLLCDTPDDVDALSGRLESTIEETFGHEVSVLTFSVPQWIAILDDCPFDPSPLDPSRVFVTLLREPAEALGELKKRPGDQVHLVGDRIYLHLPDGYGQTKLHNAFFERRLHTTATTRNWRTMLKLAALCEDS